MKCNLEKINNFFDSEIDQDIKDFVLNLFKLFLKEDGVNTLLSQMIFLDLDFYTIEKTDDVDGDEYRVINFYMLSKLNPLFRKIILDQFYNNVKSGDSNDFFENLVLNELKVLVPYEEWTKVNRKNKLEVLNDLKN